MSPRKLLVAALVFGVLAVASIWQLATWLDEHGWVYQAIQIRQEYLTGPAIAVIVALLIVVPGRLASRKSSED